MIYKKIFLILLFLTVLMSPGYTSSQDCKPPQGPPPDNADDNFSFNLQGTNITVFSPYREEFPFIGILNSGNVEAMEKILEKIGRDWIYAGKDFNPVELMKTVDLLIISPGLTKKNGYSNFQQVSFVFFSSYHGKEIKNSHVQPFSKMYNFGCTNFWEKNQPKNTTNGVFTIFVTHVTVFFALSIKLFIGVKQ